MPHGRVILGTPLLPEADGAFPKCGAVGEASEYARELTCLRIDHRLAKSVLPVPLSRMMRQKGWSKPTGGAGRAARRR